MAGTSVFGKRILIAAPHPDDEVVACCAAIRHAQADGAKVFVLFLTHGCVAKETLWPWQRFRYQANVNRRIRESQAAAQAMGLTIIGQSDRPARHLWRNLRQVHQEIRAAIATHAIDQLWVPAYENGNADHDGLNGLAGHFGHLVSILEFAEYNFAGGKANLNAFPFPDGSETRLPLSPSEQQHKRAMLALYESEQSNLSYVTVDCECWRPLAKYNYTRPAHMGTAWYARFDWVPFHHPRIDRTKPEQVCWAITAFEPASGPLESAKQQAPAHTGSNRGNAE